MRGLAAGLLLAAAVPGSVAHAADWKASCPATVSTTQSVGGALPPEWSSYGRSPSAVLSAPPGTAIAGISSPVSISVFDGPPQDMADLVPDNPNARRPQWRFAKDRKRDIWLVCNYSDTRMKLARKVPASVRMCAVDAPSGPAVSITCR